MTGLPMRLLRAVGGVLVAVALALFAVELWRHGDPAGGSTRLDARWWGVAVLLATLAGVALLDAIRIVGERVLTRTTAAPPRQRQADWTP